MKGVIKLDKKKVGQRVRLARVFYEQRTGNKMTQDILAKTIGAIRENARIANMGVAEYLQAVLDLVLDKIEIK
jgi:hypothetical protein